MKATQTMDTVFIKSMLERMEDRIIQDNVDMNSWHPSGVWVWVSDDGEPVALYNLRQVNGVTLDIHPNVLPEYRAKRNDTMKSVLDWVWNETPAMKVVGFVPTVYRNVRRFGIECGFRIEGLMKSSQMKGGKLLDMWVMGIERPGVEQ